MVAYPPYFVEAGSDPLILILSIIILMATIVASIVIIEIKCKSQKIKNILYVGLLLQLLVVIIDHFIMAFPTIVLDPRAFERSGWYSYLYGVNVGRGEYNYWIINPIYKLLGIRVAMIFSAMNVFFTILINLNIYEILKKLKIDFKITKLLMFITVLSPISLIMKAGIQREAVIILLLSYSLKNFVEFCYTRTNYKGVLAFLLVGVATIFHSGVLFLGCGYLIYLLEGNGKQKFLQYILLIIIMAVFFIFKDRLLETVGGGDVEAIISWNNYSTLKEAGSGYLQSVTTTSLGQIVLYLPFFIFYFLYSPTPDMFRGILDILTFTLNSSLFIYLTIDGYIKYKKVKKQIPKLEKKIIKALTMSLIFTVIVFSIGTRNAGTAMRHRDKIFPFLIVINAMVRNRYLNIKERKRK